MCAHGSGIRKVVEGYKRFRVAETKAEVRHFHSRAASYLVDKRVQIKVKILEVDCYEVRRELVNYMEEDMKPELRARIDAHLQNCQHCTAVYDGVRNVVQMLGREQAIELPKGFSHRLYKRLSRG
jgi:anti-sigma factor (TIGR02949 family)